MDDQMLVGVMQGRANLAEELEPGRSRKVMAIAILVDPNTINVLHDKKRNTVPRNSAPIEMRDIWIIQAREDLFFVAKSRDDVVGAHRGSDKFQCDVPAKFDVF